MYAPKSFPTPKIESRFTSVIDITKTGEGKHTRVRNNNIHSKTVLLRRSVKRLLSLQLEVNKRKARNKKIKMSIMRMRIED
jgi:hypothetical protein